ncbi:Uncharacterized conserved protein, DUF305 family [Lentzea xinjiangensis]|uniref:Uncharacterized conserved protein, DUF305 family n=1 Tax=Lentzea xinjiangensis TaxID=402600 RepID=A0A1H9T4F3_9PSEU|nr:DUF305 domain-containing protein [Lentzea xinjiangensis]SER92051.1 Uncharacterized conserved protein, DUF305 family [Lentzea xinjiangensis]
MRSGVVVIVAAFALLAGCTSEPATAPLIAPDTPGGSAPTIAPSDASGVVPPPPNDADRDYVAMMIAHHEQALAMTRFAPERAQNETVKGLAERIRFSQEPEIGAMKQWQRTNNIVGSHGDHGSMPGMATQEQLNALGAARGKDFDRMFLELMIKHHEGALKMATDVRGAGSNVQVEEMADDVIATQTDEINRMKALLPTL